MAGHWAPMSQTVENLLQKASVSDYGGWASWKNVSGID
jgi:hypothetical protein